MAADYQAPVKDMRFVFDTLLDLDRIGELDGFEAVDRDTVDQILDEAAKFAGTVMAPLNHTGDREGARLVNGVVRVPEGFADCYRQYVDAGWGSVTASADYGGMGLPLSLNIALNEMWLTRGPFGISGIYRPFGGWAQPWSELGFLGIVILVIAAVYWLLERAAESPWGRTMRAIRDNETAAAAMGKNVERFRLQAFVFGSMFMGLGGAVMASYIKFFSPDLADPLLATFLVWVMLIVGGSGNNRGAILGAFVMWSIWSMTELLTSFLPAEQAARAASLRVLLIGLALQIVLQKFAHGILPEKPPTIAREEGEQRAREGAD